MSKCKYNDNSLMPKTRKNARTRKDKTSKKKDLEDLIEEEDLDSETGSETESETDDETDDENGTSMSKELNKMMNETIDSDLTIPAIGISLIAIIGFALYKGSKM
jgi:hypothetical protein